MLSSFLYLLLTEYLALNKLQYANKNIMCLDAAVSTTLECTGASQIIRRTNVVRLPTAAARIPQRISYTLLVFY